MTTNNYEVDLHLEATELRLGLPGLSSQSDKQSSPSTAARGVKRASPEMETKNNTCNSSLELEPKRVSQDHPTPSKSQVVGWPPVRSYRKNCMEKKKKNSVGENVESSGSLVKVSMDGAPYLRKIDLKFYKGYPELVKALETMFNCTIGCYDESEYATTYEDKDGDWMLAGDVPWEMFITSCKRMRIMKGSETKGLKSDL